MSVCIRVTCSSKTFLGVGGGASALMDSASAIKVSGVWIALGARPGAQQPALKPTGQGTKGARYVEAEAAFVIMYNIPLSGNFMFFAYAHT